MVLGVQEKAVQGQEGLKLLMEFGPVWIMHMHAVLAGCSSLTSGALAEACMCGSGGWGLCNIKPVGHDHIISLQ